MFGLGSQELFIILLIVIVLYGGSRLPQVGKGIGEAIRNFKKAIREPSEVDVTPKKDGEEKKEIKAEKIEIKEAKVGTKDEKVEIKEAKK